MTFLIKVLCSMRVMKKQINLQSQVNEAIFLTTIKLDEFPVTLTLIMKTTQSDKF